MKELEPAGPVDGSDPARTELSAPLRTSIVGIVAGLLFFGVGARLYFFLLKPLWADEIFTLWMARLDLGALFAALRLDSGPPVHYLLSKVLVAPIGGPSGLDVVVRLPSLLASFAVMGLLVHLGKRLGRPEAGWGATLLFAVSPLAVNYAAEGRAYAWASLLCLLVFERCLALSERPSVGRAAALAALVALAFLSHYLTLFVVAGIGGTFAVRHREKLKYWLLAGATALVLVASWLPVLLNQPRASMDWEQEESLSTRAGVVFANLLTGIHQDGAGGIAVLAMATLLLGLAFWKRKELLPEPAGAVLLGFLLLLLGALARPEILLPERSAVLFLPLVFLTIAALGRLPVAAVAVLTAGFLAFQGRSWTRPLPIQQISEKLIPAFKDQHLLGVAGIWGPEIRYWFERSGLAGRVLLFPAELERHPGWYSELDTKDAALQVEATKFLQAAAAPDILVLPIGYRASHALRQAAAGLPSRRVAATPLFEIIEIQGQPGKPDGAGLPPVRP